MSARLADRMNLLGGEAAFELLIQIRALEDTGKTIIRLNIGEPDFDTPAHIVAAGAAALQHHDTHYTPSPGKKETREAVARFVTRTRGVAVDWQQVTIFPGAKPAIFLAMLATLNPGDEVIYPDPGYPTYQSVAACLGARCTPYILREDLGFRTQIPDLARLISPQTKMLVLNSPQNPTGGVFTQADLAAIAQMCREQNIYILSDEIYSQITYGAEAPSIYSEPGMAGQTILLDGWSKAYAMTGWRLGFTVTNRELADGLGLLMTNSNSCAAAFTQTAGIAALEGDHAPVRAMVTEFERRRDALVAGLNNLPGVQCHLPTGAFYVFPNVSSYGFPVSMIQEYLLRGAGAAGIRTPGGIDGVAVLAGTAFGPAGEGYLRLSYANSLDNLMGALEFMGLAFARMPEVLGTPQLAATGRAG